MKKIALMLVFLLCFSACFAACGSDTDGGKKDVGMTTAGVKPMDMTALNLSEYIILGTYKGMTIEYLPMDEVAAERAWEEAYFSSQILKYPQQQIDYYIDQLRARYIYIAQERGDTYESVLESLGVNDANMLMEAQYLVAADLVRLAIIEAEQIVLTEEDKTKNTERYIKQFVDEYGYTEEYIRENLMDELYEIMLEDKMMETLVVLNTFVEVGYLTGDSHEH